MAPRIGPITRERLMNVLVYDPVTGIFTWKSRDGVGRNQTARNSRAGTINSNGYRKIRIDGVSYHAGRLAFLYVTGRWPHPTVDHDNRNRSDDKWENLKEASYSEQNFNRKDPSSTSGIKGIWWSERLKKWRICVRKNGKRRRTGQYNSLEEAEIALALALQKEELNE